MMRLNLIPKREYTRASCSWHDTTARKWQFHIYNEKDRWQIDADSVTLECSNGAEVHGGDFSRSGALPGEAEIHKGNSYPAYAGI